MLPAQAAAVHRPLKRIADVAISNVDKKAIDGQSPVRLCNYVDVYNHDRITDALPFMDATASAEQVARFEVRSGDVLITKDSETPDDIAAAAVVQDDLPGVVCGYHLALLRPRRSAIHSRFLYWAITSTLARSQFSARATGITRFGLRRSAIGEIIIPVPPQPTQRAIADYLDREIAQIDVLIDKKQRLLSLSDMRIRGVIDDTLAHFGTNSNVRRHLASLIQGWSPQADSVPAENGDWGVLKVGCVNTWEYDPSENKALLSTDGLQKSFGVLPGDVLISRGNSREYVGSAVAVPMLTVAHLIPSDLLYRLRLRPTLLPAFVAYQMRSSRGRWYFEAAAKGSSGSMPKISSGDIKSFPIAVPSMDQQRAACHKTDAAIASTRRTCAALQRSISLLQERRRSLITAAVTGQIDIPEAA